MSRRSSRHLLAVLLLAGPFWLPMACVHRPSQPAAPEATPAATGADTSAQARVFDMADEHIAALGEAVYLAAEAARHDPRARRLVQSFLRNGVGATLDIAVDPNPNIAVLDLLVLASLQTWAFETHWIPAGIDPEIGQRAVERLKSAENQMWASAGRALSSDQLDTLRGLIHDWIQANPDRTVVSFVRFEEFTDRRRAPASLHQRADSLLGQIRTMAGAVADTRALVEKLVWYTGRFPYVLGEQAELTAYRLADQPEVRRLAEGSDALTRAADAMARRLDSLTADLETAQERAFQDIRQERTEGITQLFSALSSERRAVLDDLESRQERLSGLLQEFRETIGSAGGLAGQLTETALAVDRVAGRFTEEPGAEEESIDLADLRDAAAEATRLAERWTALLERVDATLLAPADGPDTSRAAALSAAVIDRIFWRSLVLVVIALTGVGILRWLPHSRG